MIGNPLDRFGFVVRLGSHDQVHFQLVLKKVFGALGECLIQSKFTSENM